MEEKHKNPWLGLNTYTEKDRLYGRDNESREVSDIVLNNLLTIIYGRSGIGKSSLLRAGVFPRMRYEDFIPVYVRMEHNTEETYLSQIGRKIKEAARDNDLLITQEENRSFGSLRDLLYRYTFTDKQTGIPKCIMLVLDQFEEIFTLTDIEHKKDVQDFFKELASVLNNTTSVRADFAQFRMVICLREDYLYFLEQNSSEIPSLKRNRYCLKALNIREGLEVICSPCPGLVDEKTANAVLKKIDTNHSEKIDPSILSLFMHELYEKGEGVITLENIQTYGDNIITNFYKDGMNSISNKSAAYLESRLVTTDGYRHSLSKADAINDGGVTEKELELLKQRRIVTIEKGENNQKLIELSHDVLCPIALKSRNERKQREEREQLESKAKAMKRRNRFILILLILAISIIGAFCFMNMEIRKQRNNMYATQSRFVSEKVHELFEIGDNAKALALLMEVCPHDLKNPNRPLVPEVYSLLLNYLNFNDIGVNKFLSGHEDYVNTAKFSPDGTKVITASWDSTAIIWDISTGNQLSTLRGHTDIVNTAEFNQDGTKIVTASGDSTAIIWDASTGNQLSTLRGHEGVVCTAKFSPDGTKVVTASGDSTAIVWDASTGNQLSKLKGHENIVNRAEFSPDGTKVVTGSWDSNAIIWDASSGYQLSTLRGHKDIINTAKFSPDGTKVVTVSDDKTARIWDVSTGHQLSLLGGQEYYVNTAEFSPDGTKMISATNGYGEHIVRIWDVSTGCQLLTLEGHASYVSIAKFSPDGTKVITASDYNNVIVWDVSTGRQLSKLRGHKGYADIAEFSPNGTKVVTGTYDNTVTVWNITKDSQFITLRGHESEVCAAEFSPDGTNVVTESVDSTIIVWDVSTGQQLSTLRGHEDYVNTAKFSPDGTKTVTVPRDITAIIWDVKTGHQLTTLRGHTDIVNTAEFSPDSKKIVTASNDRTAMIWDVKTGHQLTTLRGHTDIVNTAVFSPDGNKVVTVSGDKTARIWIIPEPQELINKALNILNDYELSPEDRKKYYLE